MVITARGDVILIPSDPITEILTVIFTWGIKKIRKELKKESTKGKQEKINRNEN